MEGPFEYFDQAPFGPGRRYVPNRRVACEPLATTAIAPEARSGFAVVKQKVALTRTVVVFGNERYRPGMSVYVRGDVVTLPWVHEVYSVGESKFILVPEDAIFLVES